MPACAPADPVTPDEFATLMDACPGAAGSSHVVLGVSGGADSMALSLLADTWAMSRGVKVSALTVDHGLRAAAAREARQVTAWLADRGVQHHVLAVRQPRPPAGVQRAARDWRFAAFDAWCRDHDAGPVLLAHTAEDQAETLWMRIDADTGPDGLGAMAAETRVAGLTIARPLLTVVKNRLIATCRGSGQDWIEDPSNRDRDFTRIRLRGLAVALGGEGLDFETAARFSSAMRAARRAINRQCARFMRCRGAVTSLGIAWFDGAAFAALPEAFAELLLSRLLRAVGGGALPARRKRVARLSAELRDGARAPARTLGGCCIAWTADGRCVIHREPAACASAVEVRPGRWTRWDNRFEVRSNRSETVMLGPLGEDGWRWLIKNGRDTSLRGALRGLPHGARLSLPAIRELDGSVSVPHFEGCIGARRPAAARLLDIGYCPDAGWIRSLATPGWGDEPDGPRVKAIPSGGDRNMIPGPFPRVR